MNVLRLTFDIIFLVLHSLPSVYSPFSENWMRQYILGTIVFGFWAGLSCDSGELNIQVRNDNSAPRMTSTVPDILTVNPRVPYRDTQINGLPVRIQLGEKWSLPRLRKKLKEANSLQDIHHRMLFWSWELLRTPFHFEAGITEVPTNRVWINLQSLDCTTFVYTVLALSQADSFEEFVSQLALLRFRNPFGEGVHTDLIQGNRFDFVYNSLLSNASRLGMVKMVKHRRWRKLLRSYQLTMRRQQRHMKIDIHQSWLHPKLHLNESVQLPFVPGSKIDQQKVYRYIKSGDIVLFVERYPKSSFFGHLAIALKGRDIPESMYDGLIHPDKIYYLQASINDDQNGEMLGVHLAGDFIEGSKTEKQVNERERYVYRYNLRSPRLASDFILANKKRYHGAVFLRPTVTK